MFDALQASFLSFSQKHFTLSLEAHILQKGITFVLVL